MDNAGRAGKILDVLDREFPDAGLALAFKTPFELLIATILSAQATDKLVNRVTGTLFKRFKGPADFARAPLEGIEEAISSINFFRNKAKSIKAASEIIVREFGGRVPDTLEGLTGLPGVGRKTANVVIGNAFGKPALAVDTHVKRVSLRVGLTASDDPDRIEEDLRGLVPPKRWTMTTRLFILHGRKTCTARSPSCGLCPVSGYCDYFRTVYKNKKGKA